MTHNTSPWKWNYFTLESLFIIKCSLCDSVFTPRIEISRDLRQHLKNKKDTKHKQAYNEVRYTHNQKGTLRWDSHYDIIPSNIILKPNIICRYCKDDMPTSSYKRIMRAPKDLGEHLKTAHNIEFKNWKGLRGWIYNKARNYYNIMSRDNTRPSTNKVRVIKVDTCTKCHVEIGAKNAIMFVKHLINEHRDDINDFPSNIIPRELLPLYSTVREDTILSSDIADRPDPSHQDSSRLRLEDDPDDRSSLDYDANDSFGDISTNDSEAENILEVLISTSSNQFSTSSNQPSTSSNQLSTSSNLLFESRNIPITSSIKKLEMMEENLKRMHEFTENTLASLKKMKKK